MTLCTDGRILHHGELLTLPAGKAELGDRRGAVIQQALLVGGVDPGPRDDLCPIARTNLVLVGIHQHIQCGGIHQPLFHQQRLERFDA